jgi:hypothetical protein
MGTPDDGAVPQRRTRLGHSGRCNFNLADVATLTAGVGYGEGLLTNKFVFEDGFANVNAGDPLEAIAFTVGLSFGLSETTTFNTQFGYVNALEEQDTSCASTNPDGEMLQPAAIVRTSCTRSRPTSCGSRSSRCAWAGKSTGVSTPVTTAPPKTAHQPCSLPGSSSKKILGRVFPLLLHKTGSGFALGRFSFGTPPSMPPALHAEPV